MRKFQMHNCSNVNCSNLQIHKCSNAQVLKCPNAQMFQCVKCTNKYNKCSTAQTTRVHKQIQTNCSTLQRTRRHQQRKKQNTTNKSCCCCCCCCCCCSGKLVHQSSVCVCGSLRCRWDGCRHLQQHPHRGQR